MAADANFAFAADFDLGLPENATVTANADNTVLTVRVTGTVPAPAATKIEGPIAITVAAPVNGQPLPTATLNNTTVTVAWSDTTAVFGDDDLVATLTVKANANYVFGTMTTANVTLSGAGYTVTNVVANGANDTLIVTATATVQKAEITALTVGLTKPTKGDTLVKTTKVSGLTPNTATATAAVSWEGDVLAPGQATTEEPLTVTVVVTAADGYVFDNDLKSSFEITGFTKTFVTVEGNVLTYVGTVTP